MVKRVIGFVAIAVLFGGCATVSMKPANLTASFSKPKSELNKSSEAYCDMAEAQGWVEASSPMLFLQRSLFPDAENTAPDADVYYKAIGAESEPLDRVETRLVEDITSAQTALKDLNLLASAYVSEKSEIARADVASFEEALVTARKSRRSFGEAETVLRKERALTSERADLALTELDAEIELSKKLADDLVSAWQNESQATS